MSEHLRVCSRCSQEYDSLLALKRRLATLATCEPREGFDEAILLHIHAAGSPAPASDYRLSWWQRTAPAWRTSVQFGAVAALGCLTAIVAMQGRPSARNTSSIAMAPPRPVVAAARVRPVAVNDLIFLHDDSPAIPARPNGPVLDTATMKVVADGPQTDAFTDPPGR